VHPQLAVADARRVRTAFANVFKPPKIAGRSLDATTRHRGRNSRLLYRSPACFSGFEHPPGKAQTADDRAPVGIFRQIARVDRRHVARSVGLRLDLAARQRPHLPRTCAQIWPLLKLAELAALKAAPSKGALHVRRRRLFQHLDRGGDDRRALGQHALAGEEPPHDLAGERQAARALVGGLGADDRAAWWSCMFLPTPRNTCTIATPIPKCG
jgi:hypothetical protein